MTLVNGAPRMGRPRRYTRPPGKTSELHGCSPRSDAQRLREVTRAAQARERLLLSTIADLERQLRHAQSDLRLATPEKHHALPEICYRDPHTAKAQPMVLPRRSSRSTAHQRSEIAR